MKTLVLTREYPPNVYGGAGVHVEHLTRELARLLDVEVRCFGPQRAGSAAGAPTVRGFDSHPADFVALDPKLRKALEPVGVNVRMAALPVDADVVHCHTWYSLMAGLWIKAMYGIPLVVTTHSLEPLRPWKSEQLGQGYALSSWIERTAISEADAVIAVSDATRREVLECYGIDQEKVRVIHNGIDLNVYRRRDPADVLRRHGIPSDRPYVLFVGRLTRQKGVIHLVHALEHVSPDLDAVICAGEPDTPEIEREMARAVKSIEQKRGGLHWVREMVPVPDLVGLYSGAAIFVCPSVYEPFGIINLEAMACGTPVVASHVGGIPEVVVHEETGLLVPFQAGGGRSFQPKDPERFAADIARAVNRLAADPVERRRMGEAGRRRVEGHFSWASIAGKTEALYREVAADRADCGQVQAPGSPARTGVGSTGQIS